MGPLEEGLARVTDAELAFALSVFLPTRARHELVAGSVPSVQALIDTLKVFPATAFLGFVSESNRSGTFTLKAKTADPFGATSRSEFGFDESAREKTSKRTFSLLSSRKSTEISSTPPANDAATLFDWVSCHSDPFHAASAVPSRRVDLDQELEPVRACLLPVGVDDEENEVRCSERGPVRDADAPRELPRVVVRHRERRQVGRAAAV